MAASYKNNPHLHSLIVVMQKKLIFPCCVQSLIAWLLQIQQNGISWNSYVLWCIKCVITRMNQCVSLMTYGLRSLSHLTCPLKRFRLDSPHIWPSSTHSQIKFVNLKGLITINCACFSWSKSSCMLFELCYIIFCVFRCRYWQGSVESGSDKNGVKHYSLTSWILGRLHSPISEMVNIAKGRKGGL